jgi:hypothetical protein
MLALFYIYLLVLATMFFGSGVPMYDYLAQCPHVGGRTI